GGSPSCPTACAPSNRSWSGSRVSSASPIPRRMIESAIHPTAIVDPHARVGARVRIGAYSVVGGGSVLEDDVVVGHHVVLEGQVALGGGVRIGHGSIVGGMPQDLKFKETTPSGVRDRPGT